MFWFLCKNKPEQWWPVIPEQQESLKFRQKVKITNWFYSWYSWIVEEKSDFFPKYFVRIPKIRKTVFLWRSEMESEEESSK